MKIWTGLKMESEGRKTETLLGRMNIVWAEKKKKKKKNKLKNYEKVKIVGFRLREKKKKKNFFGFF